MPCCVVWAKCRPTFNTACLLVERNIPAKILRHRQRCIYRINFSPVVWTPIYLLCHIVSCHINHSAKGALNFWLYFFPNFTLNSLVFECLWFTLKNIGTALWFLSFFHRILCLSRRQKWLHSLKRFHCPFWSVKPVCGTTCWETMYSEIQCGVRFIVCHATSWSNVTQK